jgi:hypothetical protein
MPILNQANAIARRDVAVNVKSKTGVAINAGGHLWRAGVCGEGAFYGPVPTLGQITTAGRTSLALVGVSGILAAAFGKDAKDIRRLRAGYLLVNNNEIAG